jgi:hypothetical protein
VLLQSCYCSRATATASITFDPTHPVLPEYTLRPTCKVVLQSYRRGRERQQRKVLRRSGQLGWMVCHEGSVFREGTRVVLRAIPVQELTHSMMVPNEMASKALISFFTGMS